MSPNSNARVDWIVDRLQVLDACRKELSRRAAYYHQALGADPQTVHNALQTIRAEELVLTVEHSVLNARIARQLETQLASVGAALPPATQT